MMKIRVLPMEVAICRLDAAAEVPEWSRGSRFAAVTRTAGELSVVCECRLVPPAARAERCWTVLELEGPIPFEQIGVLCSVLEPLARAAVSVFAISTYDTDYVLVRTERLEDAVSALQPAFEIAR
jgi:hypothetical protein